MLVPVQAHEVCRKEEPMTRLPVERLGDDGIMLRLVNGSPTGAMVLDTRDILHVSDTRYDQWKCVRFHNNSAIIVLNFFADMLVKVMREMMSANDVVTWLMADKGEVMPALRRLYFGQTERANDVSTSDAAGDSE